jgi:hypothetical protein
MTYTAEELVQNVVGVFLRRHKGEFFCVGCLGKQAKTELALESGVILLTAPRTPYSVCRAD